MKDQFYCLIYSLKLVSIHSFAYQFLFLSFFSVFANICLRQFTSHIISHTKYDCLKCEGNNKKWEQTYPLINIIRQNILKLKRITENKKSLLQKRFHFIIINKWNCTRNRYSNLSVLPTYLPFLSIFPFTILKNKKNLLCFAFSSVSLIVRS